MAGVEYQGKIYASTREINGLFQLDPITQKMVFLKRFCNERTELVIYRMAFLYKNEMWLIPGMGEHITVVNLETLVMDHYELPFKRIDRKTLSQNKGIYSSVYSSAEMIADRFLYLIPGNIDTLLLIDMQTREFYPYYDIAKPQDFLISGIYAKGSIYLLPVRGDGLIKVDLSTKERDECFRQLCCKTYNGLLFYDNKLWSVSSNGDYIINLDLDTQKSQKYFLPISHDGAVIYHDVFIVENELFILPLCAKRILRYNMDNGKVKSVDLDHKYLKNGNIILRKIFSKEKIILDSPKNKKLLFYDKNKDLLQEIRLNIDKKILLNRLEEENVFLNREGFLYNGYNKENILDIKNLIGWIVSQDDIEKKTYDDIGNDIWDAVKV